MGCSRLRSTAARIFSVTRFPAPPRPPRNSLDVNDAAYNPRSSTRRVPEHHMVPAEVCDAQDPARSTSCGRDIDTTLLPPRGQTRLRVTVCTLLTRYTIPVRRSGGYLSTPWYQPRCVMVRTRPARRHADEISIQRSGLASVGEV